MTGRRMRWICAWAGTALWTLIAGLALLAAMIGGLAIALLVTFAVVFGPNG